MQRQNDHRLVLIVANDRRIKRRDRSRCYKIKIYDVRKHVQLVLNASGSAESLTTGCKLVCRGPSDVRRKSAVRGIHELFSLKQTNWRQVLIERKRSVLLKVLHQILKCII